MMMCLLHDIFNVVRHINDPPVKEKKIELDFIVVAFLLLWVGGCYCCCCCVVFFCAFGESII